MLEFELRLKICTLIFFLVLYSGLTLVGLLINIQIISQAAWQITVNICFVIRYDMRVRYGCFRTHSTVTTEDKTENPSRSLTDNSR